MLLSSDVENKISLEKALFPLAIVALKILASTGKTCTLFTFLSVILG